MRRKDDQWDGNVARVLLYKRTHIGDPNSEGCFGVSDCMKSVRAWKFDAVIGIGGIKPDRDEPENGHNNSALNRKINWIGIGREDGPRARGSKAPILYFRKFRIFGSDGTKGPFFAKYAPTLAHRMYDREHPPRWLIIDKTKQKKDWREIEKILKLARRAWPSRCWSGGSRDKPIRDICRQRNQSHCQ